MNDQEDKKRQLLHRATNMGALAESAEAQRKYIAENAPAGQRSESQSRRDRQRMGVLDERAKVYRDSAERLLERSGLTQKFAPILGDGWMIYALKDGTLLAISFAQSPDENRRIEIQDAGFRWSPSKIAWVRPLTPRALVQACRLMGVNGTQDKESHEWDVELQGYCVTRLEVPHYKSFGGGWGDFASAEVFSTLAEAEAHGNPVGISQDSKPVPSWLSLAQRVVRDNSAEDLLDRYTASALLATWDQWVQERIAALPLWAAIHLSLSLLKGVKEKHEG